jgi:hypothetical protein
VTGNWVPGAQASDPCNDAWRTRSTCWYIASCRRRPGHFKRAKRFQPRCRGDRVQQRRRHWPSKPDAGRRQTHQVGPGGVVIALAGTGAATNQPRPDNAALRRRDESRRSLACPDFGAAGSGGDGRCFRAGGDPPSCRVHPLCDTGVAGHVIKHSLNQATDGLARIRWQITHCVGHTPQRPR